MTEQEIAGLGPAFASYLGRYRLLRLSGNGVTFDWLVFDDGYGAAVPFLEVLGLVGQRFVAEVPVNFAVRDRAGGRARRADERLTAAAAQRGRRYRLAHRTVADSVWRATPAAVWVAGRQHTLLVAVHEATGEVKYFLSNATAESAARVLAVAFRRWTVEPGFRLGKQEAGLLDYEGRDYTGLIRHLILALLVLGFVAAHTDRLRGEKPRLTAAQVCRALNQRCAAVFRRRRGTSEVSHTSTVIRYHQRRNEEAMKSHKKQQRRCVL
jgi:hypothetical protein